MLKKYIVVEGIDGTGKTTLSQELARIMNAHWTYEPYAESPVTQKLREFCLDASYHSECDGWAREYMMLANRIISTKIIKKTLSNQIVISDRSFISGAVYALAGSGIDIESWWEAGRRAINVFPDIVVNVTSNKQNIDKKPNDIYDNAGDDFHIKTKAIFPDVIEFFRGKIGFTNIHFVNDFSLSAQENATNLFRLICDSGRFIWS